jgi:hypothetical protein
VLERHRGVGVTGARADSAPVTLAIPCRTDEPGLRRTLDAAWAGFAAAGVPVATLVCLNGPRPDDCRARADVAAAAREAGRPLVEVDLDDERGAPRSIEPGAVGVLATARAGKAIAWNALRAWTRTEIVVFLDADVGLGDDAIGLLLAALGRHPAAVLVSPKTTCAPRPTLFEAVMAAPYGVDFPNLSGQLYAARTAGLPARMPEDLIEPERWLELEVGCERMVREPAATVVVRLPGTVRDFYRQRVRIEMGKVQLACDYPGLTARGNPQPRLRTALKHLSTGGLLRLAAYLALRESAYVVARRRYRRHATDGVWIQARSTKEWSS